MLHIIYHSGLYNCYFLHRQADRQANLRELRKQKYVIAIFKHINIQFLVRFSLLKSDIYFCYSHCLLAQEYSLFSMSFTLSPAVSRYLIYSFLLASNSSFTCPSTLYSIDPSMVFGLFFFFSPRRKEVVFLILFNAVREDGTLMTITKLFPILQ